MNEELKFPVQWHYHIITLSSDSECKGRLQAVLNEFDPTVTLSLGKVSAEGKYQSFRATVEFDSKEQMETLSTQLNSVEGVKFLL